VCGDHHDRWCPRVNDVFLDDVAFRWRTALAGTPNAKFCSARRTSMAGATLTPQTAAVEVDRRQ
jgi:hypothetical protein